MHKPEPWKLLIAIAITTLAGAVSALLAGPAITSWYPLLNKPSFAPPDPVFGPAWALLYVLSGVGLYFMWQKGPARGEKKYAFTAFAVQLILNALWFAIFFGSHNIGVALACVIALWLSVAMAVVEFGRVSRKAALMLFPYLAWVSYIFFLNYAFKVLNP